MGGLKVLIALLVMGSLLIGAYVAKQLFDRKDPPPAEEISQEEAKLKGYASANAIVQDDVIGVSPGLTDPVAIREDLSRRAAMKGAKYFVIKRDDNGKVIAAQLYK